jgi:hypothetical protein
VLRQDPEQCCRPIEATNIVCEGFTHEDECSDLGVLNCDSGHKNYEIAVSLISVVSHIHAEIIFIYCFQFSYIKS